MRSRCPSGGVLRKGVIYRVPSPRTGPRRQLGPDTLEVLARGRRKLIRQYLERRGS